MHRTGRWAVNAQGGENAVDNGGQRMVAGERIDIRRETDIRRFDLNIAWESDTLYDRRRCLNLGHWHGQRRPSVDDGVFAEEDDFAGGGCGGHHVGQIANLSYER